MLQDNAIRATLAHWPALAALADLSPLPPDFRVRSARSDARGQRLVLAVTPEGGRPVILKRDLRGDNHADGHFALSLAAQETARRRFAGDMRGLGVPRLLAFLPEEAIALLEEAPGQTASALLEGSDSNRDRREILELCGRWLAEFHRSAPGELRPYHTRFSVRPLLALRSNVAHGRTSVAEPQLFTRLTDQVIASAERYDGMPGRHAARHGDYNLRNVLIDRSGVRPRVSAIDFRPEQSAPAGHDVARLLIDFTTLYAEHLKIPPGELLQPAYMGAFFRGYDFVRRGKDAAVEFLVGVQLAHAWAALPAEETQRSLTESLRLAGVLTTAVRLFPALQAA